jgi:hypothetical protein
VLGGLGLAYALSGREKDARRVLDQLHELSKKRTIDPYFIAYVHMGLGEIDRTFESLNKCFEVGDMYVTYLPIDPTFADLHGDPRFKALMEKLGF